MRKDWRFSVDPLRDPAILSFMNLAKHLPIFAFGSQHDLLRFSKYSDYLFYAKVQELISFFYRRQCPQLSHCPWLMVVLVH